MLDVGTKVRAVNSPYTRAIENPEGVVLNGDEGVIIEVIPGAMTYPLRVSISGTEYLWADDEIEEVL